MQSLVKNRIFPHVEVTLIHFSGPKLVSKDVISVQKPLKQRRTETLDENLWPYILLNFKIIDPWYRILKTDTVVRKPV